MARPGQKHTTSRVATMAALAVLLALLCAFVTGAAAGKPSGAASLVEEKLSDHKKTGGPADPEAGKKKDRKDGGKGRPPKPPQLTQISTADTAAAASDGTPAGGRKLASAGGTGRALRALGDPCSVTIKNACRSKKAFQAAFAYYSFDGASPGVVTEGWWTVRYGKSFRFSATQTLYVLTKNGLKPSSTVGRAQSFCVAALPFTILDGDDGYFYVYDDDTGDYLTLDTCYEAGGYYQGGFWAPKYCGVTVVYSNC